MTNKQVLDNFIAGNDAKTNNLESINRELVSYYTSVAFNYGSFILVTNDGWTPTTKKQISQMWKAPYLIKANLFLFGRRIDKPVISAILLSLELEKESLNLKRQADRHRLEQINKSLDYLINHNVMTRSV